MQSNSLLNSLPEAQLSDLIVAAKLKQCAKGEVIWTNGGEEDFFGLVASGFVKMVRSNNVGAEMTMEIMGPGQIFGLLGVVAGYGCPLMAHGLTNTVYVMIQKQPFLSIYEQNGDLKNVLLQKTAIRIHQKLDLMAKLSSASADIRMGAVLLTLVDSYGEKTERGTKIAVPLTRQALSDMAGLTTETTIRILSRWTQEGLIHTDQQVITITEVANLIQRVSQGS